jgi:hypothetical protein
MKIENVAEKRPVRIFHLIILGMSGVLFLLLSTAALLGSCKIDPNAYTREHILFLYDNVLVNILWGLLFLAILLLLFKVLKRLSLRTLSAILVVYVTAIGFIWVCAVQSVPAADSAKITSAAADFLSGNYSALTSSDSYFKYFPFQLGYTFICEIFFTVFGTHNYAAMGMVNVIFLDGAYLALIQLSRLIFDSDNIGKLTALLLAFCFQPILFSTFIYGNIIGFAFSMWAAVFVTMYLSDHKKSRLYAAAPLIAVAVLSKPNYAIVLAALCIMLFIDCIRSRRIFNLLAVFMMIALSAGFNQLIIFTDEARANVSLGSGTPQILWAAMGLQESDMAPGWYNRYTIQTFKKNNYDADAAAAEAKNNISNRLAVFASGPQYAVSFFSEKVLSQWNEPTYESVWVSETKKHISAVPPFAESIYSGQAGSLLESYFNIYQQTVFVFFFIALLYGFRKRDLRSSLIPLIVLGGFLYHLVFEAKSQYILIYFILLIPYAAYGLHSAARGAEFLVKRFTGGVKLKLLNRFSKLSELKASR